MRSPRRIVCLIAGMAAVALSAPAGAHAADCAGADVIPAAGSTPEAGQATLCLLNGERAAQGLRPLAEAPGLTQPSLAYSSRMVAENFFAHVSPDGGELVDRLVAARYIERGGDWTVGENIAWGQDTLATPRSIVAAWMASPGHRENILTPEYTEIGIGIALGTPGDPSWGATYTTDFGAVQRTAPAPAPAAATRGVVAKQTALPRAKRCRAAGRAGARSARAKARKAGATCGRAATTRRSAR